MSTATPDKETLPVGRIKKRRDFLRAARGRSIALPGLMLQARARVEETGPARAGFTVTKKVGNAVTRNRARRRLKAAAAGVLPGRARPGWDYVLVGRAQTLTRPFPLLIFDLETAMARLSDPKRRRKEPRS